MATLPSRPARVVYKDPAVFLPPLTDLLAPEVLTGMARLHLLPLGLVWQEHFVDNELLLKQWPTAQFESWQGLYYLCNHHACKMLWRRFRKHVRDYASLRVSRLPRKDGCTPCLTRYVNKEFSLDQSTSKLEDYVNKQLGRDSVQQLELSTDQRLELSTEQRSKLHELNTLFSLTIVKE